MARATVKVGLDVVMLSCVRVMWDEFEQESAPVKGCGYADAV
jgi:hypothetical protein